jgi:lipopolysaccharide heptosyltransferase II
MLCVRLDSIGDVLMTSPALRAVKESSPGRQVTLLTSAAGAAVARLIPLIDEAITYDAPWMKATAPHADPTADLALIERLRSGAFDAAVIFTCFSQSPLPAALLCFLAGIPLRLAHCRENAYQLLSERVSECEPEGGVRHEVVRQLDLVAAVGYHTADDRLALEVPPEAKVAMTRRLCDLGLERRSRSVPWAVLHPGATAASRRYPAEQYAAVARRLVSEHGWRLLYTGGEGERELVEQVIAGSGVPGVNLAGALSLEELAALIARAPLLITNNTGPAHIAAAVGTPVVDLYAQTNPQHTPWHVPCRVLNQDVPCRWCYKSVCPQGHQRCLREVPPASVVAAAVELAWEMGRD